MREHTPTSAPEAPARSADPGRGERASAPAGAVGETRGLRRGAKALVTSGGRVLLVKEARTDGPAFWSLPGGGVERGESERECLGRELAEELRCRSRVGPAVGSCLYDHATRHVATVYTVFEATLESDPDPDPAEGIVDYAWRKPTDLPETTLRPIAGVVADTRSDE